MCRRVISRCVPSGAQSSLSTVHYSSCVFKHMSELQYPLLHTPVPFPARPSQAHPPHQPLPCSLRAKCRLWLEATHRSWADQVTDSAWSAGRAHSASTQAITVQQKPPTCKCLPELLGKRHHRGGSPCSPGQCLAGAGNHPCLAKCLWEEVPQGPGKPLHTVSCAHIHEHLLPWPVETTGKLGILLSCWEVYN